MAKRRQERISLTLFVPGELPDLDAWRRALAAKGLSLTQTTLAGEGLTFQAGVEWIDNDGSFGEAFSYGTASEAEQRSIDAAGGALVLTFPVDLHRERRVIASLVRNLAACGALAVRVEQS